MSSLQKKETLLIVDDSKFQRVVIRQSLGEYFNFAEAVSGEECLTIMEKESDAIDLVLLDLNLPEVSGFQICRDLKRRSALPVLVLTSRDQLRDEVHALELGADEYLTKPYRKERLLARMELSAA